MMRRLTASTPLTGRLNFAEIMSAGGFDVVMGNPPYLFGRDWKALKIGNDFKIYLGTKYKASPYQLDMFSIFMEKASKLCRLGGYIGQIVPNVWLTNTYSDSTRSFILQQASELYIMVPPPNCFQKLTVDTIVYTYKKMNQPGYFFKIGAMVNGNILEIATHDTQLYVNGIRPISAALNNNSNSLITRLRENYAELQTLSKITRGVHSYRIGGYGNTAFGSGYQTARDVKERPYHSIIQKKGYRSFIYGRDLLKIYTTCPNRICNVWNLACRTKKS